MNALCGNATERTGVRGLKFKEKVSEYRQDMEHKHGWEVELECPACGYGGLPRYKGWAPRYPVAFGTTPTIFAQLECPSCGRDLEPEAGAKLVELFSQVDIPRANRRLLMVFALAAAVLVAASALVFAFTRSVLGIIPLLLLTPMLASIPIFNRKIASLRQRCDCGEPDYIFMGMLGRSYCFRCSNCGRLLRLRD